MMAQLVGAAGFVDAADVHPAKLQRLQKELARLGMAPREVFGVDWAVGAGDVSLEYDRVLVDAPCSGIGTLRRRPDLALRRTPDTLANLAATQKAILSNVATRVRPGGRLVYAVCSILWEESESVVEDFLTRHPQFEATSFDNPVVHGMASGQSTLRLLPHMHGTDGYYLASFRRVSGAG
jgi:16S rRNA (cytosine967-C5)-methyltransferase